MLQVSLHDFRELFPDSQDLVGNHGIVFWFPGMLWLWFPSSRELFPVSQEPVGNHFEAQVLWVYFMGMLLFGFASAVVPGNHCPVPRDHFPVPGNHFPVPGNHFPAPRNHFPVPRNQGEEFPGRGSLRIFRVPGSCPGAE